MESQLVSFVNVLRSREVRVSPAETMDAAAVMSLLGYGDRGALRCGLSHALAKTPEEKAVFLQCFEQFFNNAPPEAGRGERSEQQPDLQGEMAADPDLAAALDIPLAQMLGADDRDALALGIARAGERVGLSQIQMFTQKGQFTRKILDELGEEHIRNAIVRLEDRDSPAPVKLKAELQAWRDRLRTLVRDHVEREYLLHAEGRNQQFMDDVLSRAKLSNIERHYLHRVHDLIRKMAKKLVARHSRRRHRARRGQLDMAGTMRRGVVNDGLMFDVRWKSVKRDRPQILAVCDVSGSVSAYSRFLLMFLYSLGDVLPQVRSFAFSSHLGEVSELFAQHPLEKAIELVNFKYGGATDYGSSLLDFATLALDDMNRNTTVIILGDARNNHGDPRLDIMQSIYARARQVIWLNPESRKLWGSGDSEMNRYRSACHFLAECGNLQQLERIIDQLLRYA